jgi:hypothetical protein
MVVLVDGGSPADRLAEDFAHKLAEMTDAILGGVRC